MSGEDHHETRQERRARKQQAKRDAIPKHGSGLRRTVVDAALRLARKQVNRAARTKR